MKDKQWNSLKRSQQTFLVSIPLLSYPPASIYAACTAGSSWVFSRWATLRTRHSLGALPRTSAPSKLWTMLGQSQFRRVWLSLTYPYLTSSSSRLQQLSSVCHSISLRKQHWIWAESGKHTFVLFVHSIHEDSPLWARLWAWSLQIYTCWGMAGHDPAFYPQSLIFLQSSLLKKIWLPPHSPLNNSPTFNYQGAWSSTDKHRFSSYGIIPHAQLPMWQEQEDWN